MTAYIVRRLIYAVPILIGVNLITFFLFFFINTPDDMARAHLGSRRVTIEQIAKWKRERDYHLPYFLNSGWTQTVVRAVRGRGGATESAVVGARIVSHAGGGSHLQLMALFQSPLKQRHRWTAGARRNVFSI